MIILFLRYDCTTNVFYAFQSEPVDIATLGGTLAYQAYYAMSCSTVPLIIDTAEPDSSKPHPPHRS